MLAVEDFSVLLPIGVKTEGKWWMESTSDALREVNFRVGARHYNGHGHLKRGTSLTLVALAFSHIHMTVCHKTMP